MTTLTVLHLAKKEIYRLTMAHCPSYNIFFDFSHRIIKYDPQVKCTVSVCTLLQPSTTS